MLDGNRIAILVEAGFGDAYLFEPMRAMKEAGARVVLVGANSTQSYQSQSGKKIITAEVTADRVMTEDFAAIIIPGMHSLDRKRFHSSVIDLVNKMHGLDKVIAAICYGPQLMISAGIVRGRRLTSSLSIAQDLKNAGADWIDEPVVQDGNIITSRKTADLPVFDWTIIEAIKANSHLPEIRRP
jgi:protease I